MKTILPFLTISLCLVFLSCGTNDESLASNNIKQSIKSKAFVQYTLTPVCKLKLNDILGNYSNKSGFSAIIKVSEKDSSKIDFVFQISKGCVRRYSGTASKEEFYSENELNYISKDTVNKIELEISMFFSDNKLAVTERTSEKKEKKNEKCVFEGHLTKLK
jgi:hypothetical protein